VLTALKLGRSRLQRKREVAEAAARAQHAEGQRELHAWLIRDRAQRVQQVLREGWGDHDPPGTQVLRWLKEREGARLHVEYVSVDAGVEARAEADWIAEPPKVFRDHRTGNPELTWTVLLHSRPIELPSRTYHEVEVRGDGLVYRRGWIYWRLHESSEGLTSTHKKEDVEVWEQYTFSEGMPG
jgi:hypothetical protein